MSLTGRSPVLGGPGLRREAPGGRPTGGEKGVDRRRLAVAGNSMGGTMAAVVALMAKHRGDPRDRQDVHASPLPTTTRHVGLVHDDGLPNPIARVPALPVTPAEG